MRELILLQLPTQYLEYCIEAIDALDLYYTSYIDESGVDYPPPECVDSCPLCDLTHPEADDPKRIYDKWKETIHQAENAIKHMFVDGIVPPCMLCPWLFMEGKDCSWWLSDYVNNPFSQTESPSSLRKNPPTWWIDIRLEQLSRWRRVILSEIIHRTGTKTKTDKK